MFINLLVSKLQLACCIGVASVSVISLPTTLVLTSAKGAGGVFKPLTDTIKKAKTQAKDKFQSFDQQLTTQYTNFGNDVVTNSQEGPKTVSTKLQNLSSGAATLAQMANKYGADINHGAFQLGHLIKAVLKHIPTIIKESIVEAISGGQDKHLLSAQKLYNIAANEKFTEFLAAMTTIVSKHAKLMENLSNEDNSGIIQIFKELRNDEADIKQFLEKVKKNADALQSNSESYKCATKLMMHVLIGKEAMDNMTNTITQLTTQLNNLKEKLTTILKDVQVDFDSLTQQLNQISNKASAIKDPCPNDQ